MYFLFDLFPDTNKLVTATPIEGAFLAAVGRYKLNYYDAKRLCKLLGGTLATYKQLRTAWQVGLEQCA